MPRKPEVEWVNRWTNGLMNLRNDMSSAQRWRRGREGRREARKDGIMSSRNRRIPDARNSGTPQMPEWVNRWNTVSIQPNYQSIPSIPTPTNQRKEPNKPVILAIISMAVSMHTYGLFEVRFPISIDGRRKEEMTEFNVNAITKRQASECVNGCVNGWMNKLPNWALQEV